MLTHYFGSDGKIPFFGKRALRGKKAAQDVKTAQEELNGKEQELIAKVKSHMPIVHRQQKHRDSQRAFSIDSADERTAENLTVSGKRPNKMLSRRYWNRRIS